MLPDYNNAAAPKTHALTVSFVNIIISNGNIVRQPGCTFVDGTICADVILVNDAVQATFHNLKFLDINRVALTINSYSKANNYTIQNSQFRNLGLHGIHSSYIDSAPKGGVTKILNNTIENSKSSGINLSVNSIRRVCYP